jgi:hypothetical protein
VPTTTDCRRAARRAALLAGLAVVVVASTGCRRHRGGGNAAPLKPPIDAYVAPEWKSFKGNVFHPPDAANHPWRVMTLQEKPRPKKNPLWRTLKPDEGVELDMPAGSRFRCVASPVDFQVVLEEIPRAPEGWSLLRTLRCSNDGWRTWSQAAISEFYDQEGKPGEKSSRQAELNLRDVIAGKPVDITMLLRPD